MEPQIVGIFAYWKSMKVFIAVGLADQPWERGKIVTKNFFVMIIIQTTEIRNNRIYNQSKTIINMVKETILKNAGEGYVSPAVEVIEVEVEQGFAASGDMGGRLPGIDPEPAGYDEW